MERIIITLNANDISYTSAVHFLTIVKYMNMNRAAEELYISQPALSLSISRLENSLGVKLFTREKKRLRLSKDGETLYGYFNRFKQAHDDLIHKAQDLTQPGSNIVNVAFTGSSFTFSALITSNFLERLSGMIVKVCFVDNDTAKEMLLSRKADIVISSMPLESSSFRAMEVINEKIGIVVNVHNPLAKCGSISLQTLQQQKFHGLAPSSNFRMLCDLILNGLGLSVDYVTEDVVSNYNLCIISSNDNCCFFSTEKVFHSTFEPLAKYCFLPIDSVEMNRSTKLYYLKDHLPPVDLAVLSNAVKECYEKRE